ncbi:MAG: Eco57I restriction-modification methylase domain-containing protein, partial [Rhabdochlamydiaceae bacterium]
MSQAKIKRASKRQFGQFMTPPDLATRLVASVPLSPDMQVLEPSFGDGSFVLALIERFLPLYNGAVADRLDKILNRNIFGVEIDPHLYQACLNRIKNRWGYVPVKHNLVCQDFFLYGSRHHFNVIIGNPPFGGTIEPSLQENLDKVYGSRNGEKIKKETYSFFVVKCLDLLPSSGILLFICSDTFMTIPTMKGLRKLLAIRCSIVVEDLPAFSDETNYPMVLLKLALSSGADHATIKGRRISRSSMQLTQNYSWAVTDDLTKYFAGPTLGDYVVCSSGMTTGNNDLFLRELIEGNVLEPFDFQFFEDQITVEKEISRAKYNSL